MTLSIILPVFNEEHTIERIIEKLIAVPFDSTLEVIIVDDGSTDSTPARILQITNASGREHIKSFTLTHNQGKGAALRHGFAQATGDILVIQDADLEYNPADIPLLVSPILEGQADVVYGSRFLGGPHRVRYYWHYVGNKFLTVISNVLTNINLTDMETGYKAFKREVLTDLTIESNRFGFEPEFTIKVAKKQYRIYEVPISYYGRSYTEGKKITWKDGFNALWTMLKYGVMQ